MRASVSGHFFLKIYFPTMNFEKKRDHFGCSEDVIAQPQQIILVA
jgi:hypothetical protein